MTDLRISIGDPIVKNNPRSAYVVTVDLMHGDADAYTSIQFGPFDSTTGVAEMERILKVVEATADGDGESYPDLENWDLVESQWDYDNTTDHQFPASHSGHHIRYFDGNGQEFEVSYGWATQGA